MGGSGGGGWRGMLLVSYSFLFFSLGKGKWVLGDGGVT